MKVNFIVQNFDRDMIAPYFRPLPNAGP